MDDFPPPPKSPLKRTAEEIEPDDPPQDETSQTPGWPQVVRRHRHRRHNVAAMHWPATKEPFNIYKAILRHPNLFFQFALRLTPASYVDLYAIDKEFHYRANNYSVSIIHDHAISLAPEASYIFSWIMYPDLCISDPLLKPMDGRPHLARDIPSLRWTKMVLWRERVVYDILTHLALAGFRVPASLKVLLMKFWVLMETRTTATRTAFLRDPDVWSDADIIHFYIFVVKLDMRFQDPVRGTGTCGLSHLLLTQKTLSWLRDILAGSVDFDYDDLSDLLIRTYPSAELDTANHAWLDDEVDAGMPFEEFGRLMTEGRVVDGRRMESPVDMLVMEGVRRGLGLHRYLWDFLLWGCVEWETGENVPVPRRLLRDRGVGDRGEGWPRERERRGVVNAARKRYGAVVVEDGDENEDEDEDEDVDMDEHADDMGVQMDWEAAVFDAMA
ncbi:hypothetical protein BDV95DRAFT_494585 [Massariosphaeria phaeospora]|uniref:Uncharacterized protein n=1 Tax=Massariosphaeria phaeospora TaxID=100035 RepID=A0A7C8MBH9_9PLEO|nr:hypothetical protein BDV95DRAFT_494585 [Massariosphaeria phaeospora]